MVLSRFSDSAHRAVIVAQTHARVFRHDVVGSEHLLLALSDADGPRAQPTSELMARCGARFDSILAQVENLRQRGTAAPPKPAEFTANAKRLLKAAMVEAVAMEYDRVEAGHLLLAIAASNEDATALRVLDRLEVNRFKLREHTLVSFGFAPAAASTIPAAPPRLEAGTASRAPATSARSKAVQSTPVGSLPVQATSARSTSVHATTAHATTVEPGPRRRTQPEPESSPTPKSGTPQSGVVVVHLSDLVADEAAQLRARAQEGLPDTPVVGFDGAKVDADGDLWQLRKIPDHGLLVLMVIGRRGIDPAGRLGRTDSLLQQAVSVVAESQVPVVPVLVGGATMPPRSELPHSVRRLAWMLPHTIVGDPAAAELGGLFDCLNDLSFWLRGKL
jgi:ATP-dependent Clp protease ATP-binding subunit ClpC